MGRILSEGEYWKKLGIYYAYKIGYWAGRAVIGDAKENIARRKEINKWEDVVTWRTEIVAKRVVNGLLSLNMGDTLSYFVHKKHLNNLKTLREAQKEAYTKLIEGGVTNKEKTYGYIELADDKNQKVWALDAEARVVRDSLILYYVGSKSEKKSIKIPKVSSDETVATKDDSGKIEQEDANTAYVFFCDLSPEIIMESSKNLVLTPVQGRNYTRKELISCGDMIFTIRGSAVSHNLYAYPKEEVASLLNIYLYGGIVEVNNMVLDNYGVKRLLIKSLHFDNQEYNNIQPYTMQCIAVEPKDVKAEYSAMTSMRSGAEYDNGNNTLDIINKIQKLSGININISDLIGGNVL